MERKKGGEKHVTLFVIFSLLFFLKKKFINLEILSLSTLLKTERRRKKKKKKKSQLFLLQKKVVIKSL